MSYLGNVSFYPIRGELNINVAWFGKQSPYIKVRLDGQKKKCKANYDGGQHPKWSREELNLEFFSNSGNIQVECIDYAVVGRGTYIGIGSVNVHQLIQNGVSSGLETVAVSKNTKTSGHVVLDWRFVPSPSFAARFSQNHQKQTTGSNENSPFELGSNKQKSNESGDNASNRNTADFNADSHGGSKKNSVSSKKSNELKYNYVPRSSRDGNIGKKIGKYVIEKHLGSGQFGDVYRAQDGSENPCAIKIVAKAKVANPVLLNMLKSEVNIMKKLDHPNIIKLYDFMESSSNYYIAMQLCNNGDVRQYMKKRGITYFKEEEAVFFLKQISMGFRELHSHKVMHRDFKVDNLFMDESTIVIADLGFAKAGRDMTKTVCGTPLYMAPEVFENQPYTNLADLWSVGVTFFEILFGRFPFDGKSEPEILRKMMYNSGKNLAIPTHINPVSKICQDFLQQILESDLRKRMSWETFFKHPIFNIDKSCYETGNYNPLGSTIQCAMDVNHRFEQHKNAAPPQEEV